MPEPLLHFGNVGFVVERVSGGRGAQRVCALLLGGSRRGVSGAGQGSRVKDLDPGGRFVVK